MAISQISIRARAASAFESTAQVVSDLGAPHFVDGIVTALRQVDAIASFADVGLVLGEIAAHLLEKLLWPTSHLGDAFAVPCCLL